LAISPDGKRLVVANSYNDSISVIDTVTNTVRYEHDLRPFAPYNEGKDGLPGGRVFNLRIFQADPFMRFSCLLLGA
jgi:hypothetical protein